ncbi:MAG TPA: glutamine amidotransferase [Luteimonas sp.]|nr:glutamine amidotransferase [Luteimonas sp.]
MHTPAPFLIVQTGQPVASMRRHGGFPQWIRTAAGLRRADAVAVDVESGAPLPDGRDFTGVILTGSGAMVTERRDWSERTAAWLAQTAHAGVPVFGICYGHQLLAHALGGTVGNNAAGREMGTVSLSLEAAAAHDALFAGLPRTLPAQATHVQSVLQPPAGATVLATSALDACHAFRWGDAAWGVQFHPEFSRTHMLGYVRARRDALRAEGLDARLIERSVRAAPVARRVLRRFVAVARGARATP